MVLNKLNMKFKKSDLKELVSKYQNDPHKLYEELINIANEIPKFQVAADCDNLLDYNDGLVNIEFKNKKWQGSVLFINGSAEELVIFKN